MNLRQEARNRDCLIRIPGHCNHDPATSCLCHLPGGGMARKRSDLSAAIGCSGCHDVIDGRVKTDIPRETLDLWHHEGVRRTVELWESLGIVRVG